MSLFRFNRKGKQGLGKKVRLIHTISKWFLERWLGRGERGFFWNADFFGTRIFLERG
jgi:hypothetical protein